MNYKKLLNGTLLLGLVALGFGGCSSNKKKVRDNLNSIINSTHHQNVLLYAPRPSPYRPAIYDTLMTDPVINNIEEIYDHIYTIKVDRIEVEYAGLRIDPGILLSDVVCGTGFMLENGTFITDRQHVQPWVYNIEGQWKEPWRHLMAQFVACGAEVIIHYRAYSTKGTGKPLAFVNTDFVVDGENDKDIVVEIKRKFRSAWRYYFGVRITEWTAKKYHMKVGVISESSTSYAYIRGLGSRGEGIPYDTESSVSMSGGTEIQMVGYARKTDEYNLIPVHFNDRINVKDTLNETIILQGQIGEAGYYGSPAFYKDKKGEYHLIGMMVESPYGKDRLIPLKSFMN